MKFLPWNFRLVDVSNIEDKNFKALTRVSSNGKAVLKNLFPKEVPLTIKLQLNSDKITASLCSESNDQKLIQEFLSVAERNGLQLRLDLLTNAFDIRKVEYEKLHDVKSSDLTYLIDCLELKNNMKVLDMMCGYGIVGEKIFEHASLNKKNIKLTFCDLYETQLQRMKEEVKAQAVEVRIGDARQTPFADAYFDAIVIKMGIHDVPRYDQLLIFQEAYRMLKPGGIFAIWDVILDDAETQDAFMAIINKKDSLAGYESYLCDRYFFRIDQAYHLYQQAGFSQIEKICDVHFQQSTLKRRDSELQGDNLKLTELNNYIRQVMTPKLQELMKFEEHNNDIKFVVPNRIMRGRKI